MNNTARLNVRIMEHRDIENARLLHNDDSVLENLTDVSHVSEIQQEEWFKKMSMSSSSIRYVLLESNTGAFVGVFRVDNLDHKNKSVMVGLDIVKDKRGLRYSYEAYEYFLSYFFTSLGMNRVYLMVLDSNPHARRIYEKLGFKEEGRQREAVFRHNKYVDYVMMSILRKEYVLRNND